MNNSCPLPPTEVAEFTQEIDNLIDVTLDRVAKRVKSKHPKLSKKAIAAKIRQYNCVHCDQSDEKFLKNINSGMKTLEAYRDAYIIEMKKKYGESDPYYQEVIEAIEENKQSNHKNDPIGKALASAVQGARGRVGLQMKKFKTYHAVIPLKLVPKIEEALTLRGLKPSTMTTKAIVEWLENHAEETKQLKQQEEEVIDEERKRIDSKNSRLLNRFSRTKP